MHFGDRAVAAVSFAAHRALHGEGRQLALEVPARSSARGKSNCPRDALTHPTAGETRSAGLSDLLQEQAASLVA